MDVARRQFLVGTGAAAVGVAVVAQAQLVVSGRTGKAYAVPVPGGTLDPLTVPKFVTPLLVPPVMPRRGTVDIPGLGEADRYDIAVRQLTQQILPVGMPATTVWGYGDPGTPGTFNAPSFTVEARWRRPVRVRWINQLVDGRGRYLPPILPVDQTLHWANPVGGTAGRDMHGADGSPYRGPVPITTHVHGAKTFEDSDGYPESWFLPNAVDLPAGYARAGSFYDRFRAASRRRGGAVWAPGTAVYDYPNDQRAGTLWYHDHTLGMTRTNVYSGPAGFYLLRGGPDDVVRDTRGRRAALPGPAPRAGEKPGTAHYEIPIAIQDRSFGTDGSLFYPDSRLFFDGFAGPYLPDPASDISPIWNPEFFGNHVMVNGATWPYLQVEQRRYRFRLLNGCNSRFLILELSNGGTFWQIGTEGGFLPAPVPLTRLLMAPAERADVIVDFSGVPAGTEVLLRNVGPDEPFGGGEPDVDFDVADPGSTGQVMMFRVVEATSPDPSTPPDRLVLPAITGYGSAATSRAVSLNEASSALLDPNGNPQVPDGEAAGPRAALLGTVDATGAGVPLAWMDPVTETSRAGKPEIWEIHNYTVDAHPIHLHATLFQVLDRAPMAPAAIAAAPVSAMAMRGSSSMRHTVAEAAALGPAATAVRGPETWETGFKDTVIAYPGEVTRVLARFDRPGRFVWHCHIVEHEDNEMMRPFDVV